jgi:two-component system, chemotaxis family, protein-glutamate methylesterase/glutaminase
MHGRTRVLVVEDSPTVRQLLVSAFDSAPDMHAVATAADGYEAVAATRELRPDVVTMDVNMPRMDGLDATRAIMRDCPVPIVIVSGALGDQVSATFRSLDAGALAFVRTPSDERGLVELVATVRLMAEVKVVRRRGTALRAMAPPLAPAPSRIEAVAIGASTGGPLAVRDLLEALSEQFRPPVLIVQHIAPGFVEGFAGWLGDATGRAVRVVRDGERLLPGNVYVAPDGRHLGMKAPGLVLLSDDAPAHGMRPAVSHLFQAVRRFHGANAAAVLLSGMGKDGAQELLELRREGAVTFAQNAETAIVFGMPGEAQKLDAARYVMAPSEIGAALAALA